MHSSLTNVGSWRDFVRADRVLVHPDHRAEKMAGSKRKFFVGFYVGPNKKAPRKALFYDVVGGVDGTRTRDPRRDRPVF